MTGNIKISLTHPQCSAVTIPFKVLPRFKADPVNLVVFKAESKKPVKKEVWILSNYDEDFEVESTSSQKNTVKVLSQEKVGNRYKLELEITPPVVKGKQKIFNDIFFVNIKGGDKVRIVCRGFYVVKKQRDSQADKS